jgi:DNA-binding NtrC family response regulator
MLERYSWPGNARELRNVLERAIILEEGRKILPEHLPDELQPGARAIDLEPGFTLPPGGINLEKLEKDLLRQAVQRARGNKTRAGELLCLSRDTLRYRLDKHGISAESIAESTANKQ